MARRRTKTMLCNVCGHERPRSRSRCAYCHAIPREWAFLARAKIKRLSGKRLNLRCPMAAANYRGRCDGRFTAFTVADLHRYPCTGGNGPWTYTMAPRFKLQGRCGKCEHYAFDRDLLRGNRGAIRRALGAPGPVS